jgi:hypothetical protein
MKVGQEDVGGTKLATRKGDYHRALRELIPLLRGLGYCWMAVCTICLCSFNKIYRHSKSRNCALIDELQLRTRRAPGNRDGLPSIDALPYQHPQLGKCVCGHDGATPLHAAQQQHKQQSSPYQHAVHHPRACWIAY